MRKKILVVDDSQSVRALLRMMLGKRNYKVLEAKDGIEGLQIVEKEKPDLIVSDIMMPKMDGFEFCKWVREMSDIQDVPFIFLTSVNQVDLELKGFKLGAQEYLIKSDLKKGKVVEKIESILKSGSEGKTRQTVTEGISGKLGDMSLIEILQIISMNKKTGILGLTYHDDDISEIFFSSGNIIHVEYQGLTGEMAFNRLVYLKEGNFNFKSSPIDVTLSISRPTSKLFLNFVDLLDETAAN